MGTSYGSQQYGYLASPIAMTKLSLSYFKKCCFVCFAYYTTQIIVKCITLMRLWIRNVLHVNLSVTNPKCECGFFQEMSVPLCGHM